MYTHYNVMMILIQLPNIVVLSALSIYHHENTYIRTIQLSYVYHVMICT